MSDPLDSNKCIGLHYFPNGEGPELDSASILFTISNEHLLGELVNIFRGLANSKLNKVNLVNAERFTSDNLESLWLTVNQDARDLVSGENEVIVDLPDIRWDEVVAGTTGMRAGTHQYCDCEDVKGEDLVLIFSYLEK